MPPVLLDNPVRQWGQSSNHHHSSSGVYCGFITVTASTVAMVCYRVITVATIIVATNTVATAMTVATSTLAMVCFGVMTVATIKAAMVLWGTVNRRLGRCGTAVQHRLVGYPSLLQGGSDPTRLSQHGINNIR